LTELNLQSVAHDGIHPATRPRHAVTAGTLIRPTLDQVMSIWFAGP
jgi:hypothetical protein